PTPGSPARASPARGRGASMSRRPRRRPRVATRAGLATGGALVALVLSPATAGAQPFGPGACGGACFYADNSNETFYYNALGVGDIDAMEFARFDRLEPTDMSTKL